MKLSTRARYGLRLCFLVSIAENTVSLTTLCEQSGVSDKYAEQIISKLKKADILVSERGTNGGYRLKNAPDKISVAMVLDALDDNFEFNCDTTCKDIYCPNKRIFGKLSQSIKNVFDNTTLKDMKDDYKCI